MILLLISIADGSKTGDRVGAAVHRYKIKCVRLPNTASIFRAELYALLLAIDVVRRSNEKKLVIFFRFHLESSSN